jgi:hypothetical protein
VHACTATLNAEQGEPCFMRGALIAQSDGRNRARRTATWVIDEIAVTLTIFPGAAWAHWLSRRIFPSA